MKKLISEQIARVVYSLWLAPPIRESSLSAIHPPRHLLGSGNPEGVHKRRVSDI